MAVTPLPRCDKCDKVGGKGMAGAEFTGWIDSAYLGQGFGIRSKTGLISAEGPSS